MNLRAVGTPAAGIDVVDGVASQRAREDMAHVVVWQSLMIFLTVLLWLVWIVRSKATHETSPA